MEQFIEIIQVVVFPSVTIILGYFGWKARLEKNKLQAELKSKDIENDKSLLDYYKEFHTDQSQRMVELGKKQSHLENEINKLKHAISKMYGCPAFSRCPIRIELQKSETRDRKDSKSPRRTHRPREPTDDQDSKADNDSTGDGETLSYT